MCAWIGAISKGSVVHPATALPQHQAELKGKSRSYFCLQLLEKNFDNQLVTSH